jgi:hypothetical protein
VVTQTPGELRHLLGESAPLKFAPDQVDMQRPVRAAELDAAAALADKLDERERLIEMAAAVRQGATVMPVDAEVAHAQRIGRRELERRRARRKAQAKARRNNRA